MIAQVFKNILRLLGPMRYARRLGVTIGENCRISTYSWGSEPYLIEIGNHVHVTLGVKFVTHDGAVWVFREKIPDLDVFGKIRIGDNTFIGNNATILPGVTIGRNCIVGAESVVTKSVPDNTVVAGNPAKFVTDTESYLKKIAPLNAKTKLLNREDKKRAVLNLDESSLIFKDPLRRP